VLAVVVSIPFSCLKSSRSVRIGSLYTSGSLPEKSATVPEYNWSPAYIDVLLCIGSYGHLPRPSISSTPLVPSCAEKNHRYYWLYVIRENDLFIHAYICVMYIILYKRITTYGQIEYFAHWMKSICSTDKQFLVVLFVRNSYVILAIVLKRDIQKM